MKTEQNICDKCKRDIICVSFTADPHYYEITLCRACLTELLKEFL